jgi:aspartate kinase
MSLIVQKFGGASLQTVEKVKAAAKRIAAQRKMGDDLIIVVSAMGRATDEIIALFKEISEYPEPREFAAALSTGEIKCAAMLAAALNDIDCPAISLMARQAEIVTDNSFSNASISSIDYGTINREISAGRVVVITGFQGTNRRGEVTTLGRGGSDTTAVAVAASVKALRCEILKEVPGIFTANPNVVPNAIPLKSLSYRTLLEMTYWGAKVLNYRSAEIANRFRVPLYIGPAHSQEEGTQVEEENMIQSSEIVALSSYETVLLLKFPGVVATSLTGFRLFLNKLKIPFPQILHVEAVNENTALYITGPTEVIKDIQSNIPKHTPCSVMCSITAICRGTTQPELLENMVIVLEKEGINIISANISAASVALFMDSSQHDRALKALHKILERPLHI